MLITSLRSPSSCADDSDEISNSSVPSLISVIEAQSVRQELQSISFDQSNAGQHEEVQGIPVGQGQKPVWQEGLCGVSLLPLQGVQLPLTSLSSGQLCRVSLQFVTIMHTICIY